MNAFSGKDIFELVEALKSKQMQMPKACCVGMPNPPALTHELTKFEEQYAISLPRSYKDFLLVCNGWPNFLGIVDLLSLDELGGDKHKEMQEMAVGPLRSNFLLENYGYVRNEKQDDYQNLFLIGHSNGTADDFLIDLTGTKKASVFWTVGYIIEADDDFAGFLEKMLEV